MGVDQETAAAEQLDVMLAALSSHLGQPVTRDAGGQCALMFEGDIELVIEAMAIAGEITLRGRLDADSGPQPAPRLRRALALNYGELPPGMAIGLDMASNQILLLARLPAETTPASAFVETVATLVDISPRIRSDLTAHAAAPDVEFPGADRPIHPAGWVRG